MPQLVWQEILSVIINSAPLTTARPSGFCDMALYAHVKTNNFWNAFTEFSYFTISRNYKVDVKPILTSKTDLAT